MAGVPIILSSIELDVGSLPGMVRLVWTSLAPNGDNSLVDVPFFKMTKGPQEDNNLLGAIVLAPSAKPSS